MSVFPISNLPVQTQPWGREVEKRLVNLDASFRAAEVNNVTRDSQMMTNYRRLDAAITQLAATTLAANTAQDKSIEALQKADDALAEIIDLGAPGGPTINAANITAGSFSADIISGGTIDASDIVGVNITGANILTAASGTRVDLSGSNIEFFSSEYSGGASRVGYIQGDNLGDAGLYVISDQGSIALDAVSITLSGDTTITGGLSVGDFLEVTGTFSPTSIDTGDITSTGAITASSLSIGTTDIGGTYAYAQSVTGDSVGGGFANFTGSVTGQSGVISNSVLTRTELAGGGTTGASVTNGGNFVRTTSSQRYKTDIQPLELDLADLYQVEPKTFKRIDEVEEDPESARVYPGFIAEELAGTSLDKFVFYSKDEQGNLRPEGIHYPELTAALLLAIKDLNARIEALEA